MFAAAGLSIALVCWCCQLLMLVRQCPSVFMQLRLQLKQAAMFWHCSMAHVCASLTSSVARGN
jgi:hypothetical protein